MDLTGGQLPGDGLAVGRDDQVGLLVGLDERNGEVTAEEVAGLGGTGNAGGVLIDVPSAGTVGGRDPRQLPRNRVTDPPKSVSCGVPTARSA